MPQVRQVIENFGRCCECLLSTIAIEKPLSQEETQFIQYYVGQMEKKFDGPAYRREEQGRS